MRDQGKYTCRRLEDLWQVIVPHFERYPLLSKKANDFLLWKKALDRCVCGNKSVPMRLSNAAVTLGAEIFQIAADFRARRKTSLQRGENSLRVKLTEGG
jgi:hypothetical protein